VPMFKRAFADFVRLRSAIAQLMTQLVEEQRDPGSDQSPRRSVGESPDSRLSHGNGR